MFAIIIVDFQFITLTERWRNITENCECFIMVLLTIGGYVKLYIIIFKNENVRLGVSRSFASALGKIANCILYFVYCFSDRMIAVALRLSLARFHAFSGSTSYARVRYRRKKNDDNLQSGNNKINHSPIV